MELKRRTRLYPQPTKVGIDEHPFKHDFKLEQRRFVTMVVDHKNKRLMYPCGAGYRSQGRLAG